MWAWALLPICLSIWAIVGTWVVYVIAVNNGSVNITEQFPYISTCGSYPPQSCIFAQVLNVGAMLAVWISAMRFQQIRDRGFHSHLNSVSLAMGLLTALGTSIVANFQQSNQLETHLVGAFLAFFVGTIYFWTQTVLTFQMKPRGSGRIVGILRFCFSILCTALIAMMIAFFAKSMPSEAAICEWIAAMILFLLYGLFSFEFYSFDGHFVHVMKRRITIPNEMQVSTVTLTT
ncbi:modulator of macroautophagy TMEM150B [Spea bombifrons]|uniref:modulator of macroautophagy TMEM150B n=1 Tax=Spea bombifrons TaxID=233779 RepID=UPI00234A0FBB|nr:modulator of macroautophagy TMEM150B [Spea bombifrons]